MKLLAKSVIGGKVLFSILLTITFCYVSAQDSIPAKCDIKIKLSVSHVSCKGGDDGAIHLQIENAQSPIFEWTNGESSQNIMMLSAGEFSVKVTDGDCSSSSSASVLEPNEDLKIAILAKEDVSCFGLSDGRVELLPEGGTEPYSFSMEGNGFHNNEVFEDLDKGEYTFTVRDSKECESNILISIEEPPQMLIDLGSDRVIESGNEVNFDVGSTFSDCLWSTGETSNSITFSREVSSPTDEYLSVDAIDENGCVAGSNQIKISILPGKQPLSEENSIDIE